MSDKSPQYSRENPVGFLERAGVNYYRRLASKVPRKEGQTVSESYKNASNDESLRFLSVIITDYAAIIAFWIGAACSIPSVLLEWHYAESLDLYHYLLLQALIGLVFLLIELLFLFWLGLKTVHSIACLTQHDRMDDYSPLPGDDTVANLMARAALELPDPVIRYLGVDPLKYVSKPKLFVIGLFYKLKVILTSAVLKLILTRMAGKLGLRAGFSWIAIPVTGIWDAVVIYRVVKEARLRLFGHRLAHYLVEDVITEDLASTLSPKAREGAIRAIATMMVLTQNYHPNMLMLLYKFSDLFDLQDQSDYDDWNAFVRVLQEVSEEERFFLLDLLGISAVFDGKLSQLELKQLPTAFGRYNEVYMLRINQLMACLTNGHIDEAKNLCRLNFRPDID